MLDFIKVEKWLPFVNGYDSVGNPILKYERVVVFEPLVNVEIIHPVLIYPSLDKVTGV